MKTALVLTVASSLLLPWVSAASDTHDADRGLESNLRTELNDKHVHVHVHRGIVTIDGKVRTEADRERIESIIRNTVGVVAMKDELKVTLPAPGSYGVAPSGVAVTPSVPVYAAPFPEVVPPVTVVTAPEPVVIPDYPKLKVQAWSPDDRPMANRIARQLRADAVPTTGIEDVTIVARGGSVSLKGSVEGHEDRVDIISSIQHVAGVNAIYDQLHIK
jgi:hypothetical protein